MAFFDNLLDLYMEIFFYLYSLEGSTVRERATEDVQARVSEGTTRTEQYNRMTDAY